MAILKCKMCGGDIIAIEGQTYGTCDSCGSTVTLPNVNDQRMENLFNRANHFRMVSEFDKAVATYEMILNEDNSNAEAHWGLLLSRYGIEYVEDPVSHERIPTCHRIQNDPILTDDDYLAAVQHAPDSYTRSLYESEGKRLSELQRGLLQVSAQTEPFDIFICYKETTESGSRTKDSTLAQDIYYQLTNAGYNVFFSRITLEGILGQEYEPHIFAALNSAKVMLAIGTKIEYFNAVWVKNEWKRFLALSKKDRRKVLIPCYMDLNVYDLPDELSILQCQDMSKIGFIQDLLRGIDKITHVNGQDKNKDSNQTSIAPSIDSLLKRAALFLEDANYTAANEYAEKVLDIDPECASAYIIKVQVAEQCKNESDLANCSHPLTDNTDYQKALRFSNGQQKNVYEGYNQTIQNELLYKKALAYGNESSVLHSSTCAKIAEIFDSLGNYKDSKKLATKYHEMQQAMIIREGIEAQRKEEERLEQERIEKKKREEEEKLHEQQRVAEEEGRRLKKKRLIIGWLTFLGIISLYLFITFKAIPAYHYKEATKLLNDGMYDEAYTKYKQIGPYKNAHEMANECQYQKAKNYLEKKDPLSAIGIFSSLVNYKDSKDMLLYTKETAYSYAEDYLAKGNYTQAIKLFVEIVEVKDSSTKIIECGQHVDDAVLINTIKTLISRYHYSNKDNLEMELAYGGKLEDLYLEVLGLYLNGTWKTTKYQVTTYKNKYDLELVEKNSTNVTVNYTPGKITLKDATIPLKDTYDNEWKIQKNMDIAYKQGWEYYHESHITMNIDLNSGIVTVESRQGLSSLNGSAGNYKLTMIKKDANEVQ